MENSSHRTLVCECAETVKLPFEEEKRSYVFCDVSAVNIDVAAAGLIGKEVGRYVSISFGSAENMEAEALEEIARVTADELKKLISMVADGNKSPKIIVVGLGNEGVTHDSLGARVCSLLKPSPQMAVLKVGTAGQSGLESAALVKMAADSFGADLVVAIDSLAAFGESRVGRVIQLTDSGIEPASGVRADGGITPINKESIGLPVIAVGVPTALICEDKRADGYLLVGENILEICRKISELLEKSICMVI